MSYLLCYNICYPLLAPSHFGWGLISPNSTAVVCLLYCGIRRFFSFLNLSIASFQCQAMQECLNFHNCNVSSVLFCRPNIYVSQRGRLCDRLDKNNCALLWTLGAWACCMNISVSCKSSCPSQRYVEAYLNRYYGNQALPLFQNT